MIEIIKDLDEKKRIARTVLEGLKEWFEVEESREGYIRDCADWIFLAAKGDDKVMGFLCLKETGNATVELAVMGVLKDYHRNGIGRQLVDKAIEVAESSGYEFMQVKTVKMGVYEDFTLAAGLRSLNCFRFTGMRLTRVRFM